MSYDPANEFRAALIDAIASFGLDPLTGQQSSQLEKHYAMLVKWNQRINLTRISAAPDAAKLHYAESLFGARFIAGAETILDIGSGAGFPAIPLAVARPDVQVTALEANQKKSLFLKEAKDELALANLKVMNARLEDVDWTGYELLTSRALDRAETILPSLIQRLNEKQKFMLYCASDLVEKLAEQTKYEIAVHSIPLTEARIIAIVNG